MADFALATYHVLPDLDPDDRVLAEALEKRGKSVRWAVWNDPAADWDSPGTVVVRSTWDYHEHHAAFLAWVERVAARGPIVNPPGLIRWGAAKTYLADLEASGVPAAPTVFVDPKSPRGLADVARAVGWGEVIVKPAVGLATAGVKRVSLDAGSEAIAEGEAHLAGLLRQGTALVQRFLPGVADNGERALIFVDGAYTHAVSKSAFQAMAVAGQAGERAAAATPAQIALGERALAVCPQKPVFARVDMVEDAGEPLVMELEVVEPSLFLSFGPHAAEVLADVLVARSG